jgi:hypothetical protein
MTITSLVIACTLMLGKSTFDQKVHRLQGVRRHKVRRLQDVQRGSANMQLCRNAAETHPLVAREKERREEVDTSTMWRSRRDICKSL